MKRRYKPSVFRDVYHEQSYSDLGLTRLKLFKSSKNSLGMVQRLDLMKRLPVHNGCVNSICWNETGDCILSGSDDQHIVVSHGFNHKVLTDFKTSHRANIFSAKFLPGQGDRHIVSCSGDGIILFTDLNRPLCTSMNQFSCHSGTTYDVITVPSDPYSFLSCGEDGTVRWFDLRVKDKCRKTQCKEDILITCQRAVTSLSMNPTAPYQLAVGCSDSRVRLFDRRMLGTEASGYSDRSRAHHPLSTFTAPSLKERSCRITSLHYSPDGQEILVSFSSDLLYLFSMKDRDRNGNSSADCDIEEPSSERTPVPVRRLRLRGDWSDTGPNARPERDGNDRGPTEFSQTRRTLHASLMQRMTDVLARMLNDPATRANLNSGRQESRPEDEAEAASNAAPGDFSRDSPMSPDTSPRSPDVPRIPLQSPHSPMFPFEHPLNESFAVNPFLPLDSPLSPDSTVSTEYLSSPVQNGTPRSSDLLSVHHVLESVVLESPMSPDVPTVNVLEDILEDSPMSPDPVPDSPMSPDPEPAHSIQETIVCESPMSPDPIPVHIIQVNAIPDSPMSPDPLPVHVIQERVLPDSPISPDLAPVEVIQERDLPDLPIPPDHVLVEIIQECDLPDSLISPVLNTQGFMVSDSPISLDPVPVQNINAILVLDSPMLTNASLLHNTQESVTESLAASSLYQRVSEPISISCISNESTACFVPESSPSTTNGKACNCSDIPDPSSASSISNLLLKCVESHPCSCNSEDMDAECLPGPTQSCVNLNYCSIKTDIPDSPMSPELQCDASSNKPSTSNIPLDLTPNQSTSSLAEPTILPGTSCVPEAQDPTTSSKSTTDSKNINPKLSNSSNNIKVSIGAETTSGQANDVPESSTALPRFTIGDPQAKMELVDPSLDDNFQRDSPMSPVPNLTENVAVQVTERIDVTSEDELDDGAMSDFGRQDMELVLESNSSDDDITQQFPRVMFPRPRQVMIPPADEMQLRSNEDLIDTLHSMRDRHLVEPAVLLSVSEVTDDGAAFAVRVATDNNRGPPHIPYLMENQRGLTVQRPSVPPPIPHATESDYFTNEELEDDSPNVRLIHPIEREMDSAIAEARSLGVLAEDGCTFQPSVKQIFSGHRNARTMIKEACFWGTDYVMSGSDCGHVFVWERSSGQLVQLFEGDEHVVNCLQPHPTLPVLATSGIDYDVKLWAPLATDSTFDSALADLLKKRNEIMLEETKDTITVPATFMIRMLACLNQIRRGGRRSRRTDDESNE